MTNHVISSHTLLLKDLQALVGDSFSLSLGDEARRKISRCREYLDEKIASTSEPVYGINTGFGSLYDRNIGKEDLGRLQNNLVKSHACGMGPEIPQEIVRLMLFLKIQSLSYGNSGVQVETVERLMDLYNNRVYPKVFEMGSLGASGDLAPLAHLSLPLIGLGDVHFEGKAYPSKEILDRFHLKPIQFKAKEGLALLNGTQFMTAFGTWCVVHAHRLLALANRIGALSLDVFDGRLEPFDPKVHAIRPQKGQGQVAEVFRRLLKGSELIGQQKNHVQDPYSFRCIPQVHGASMDAVGYVTDVMLAEVNGVTDNPNVFPDEDVIISAGNFHGQPLALALDFLAIAVAELGSISERRTYQLISGSRNLPNYLVANPGINSGLMMPQYTAASLVSQNKQLCTPASVDSIVSSNGQEDHVSMGANAALKAHRIVMNVYSILAIELVTASQGLEFRRPMKSSPVLEKFVHTFRAEVPFMETDRLLHNDLVKADLFCRNAELAEN
ncbi:MAG: histidine ammonia-lyase [Cytophagales bacterium]|nr:histidine ammonia-lyase [Cytophagales bacterium]